MAYLPPGVHPQTLTPGLHPVFLTDLEQITQPDRLAKFNAQAVFVAKFKSVQGAIPVDLGMKFRGTKGDYYAGLNGGGLHVAAGLDAPAPGENLDLENLKNLLDGVELTLEINDLGYGAAIFANELLGEDVV